MKTSRPWTPGRTTALGPVNAAAVWGSGWRVCLANEIEPHQMFFDTERLNFAATVDDGPDCVLVNQMGASQHKANRPFRRPGQDTTTNRPFGGSDRDTIEAWLRKMQRAASEEDSDGGKEVERQVGRRLRGGGRKAPSPGVAGPIERRSAGVRAVTHGEWPSDGSKKLIDIDALLGPEA